MKSLHICHISTTFNLKSGSARRTSAILRECVAQGYRVSLIHGRDYDVTAADLPGVELYCVPQLVKYVQPLADLTAPWHIRKVLVRIRPDLVHTHLAKGGVVGRLAAAWAGIGCIVHTVHGPTFPEGVHPLKRTVYRSLEKLCGRLTDYFVFVGEELRQSYIRAGVCRAENSGVIQTGRPPGVIDRLPLDDQARQNLRRELSCRTDDDFLVVAVGRIVPAKRLDHAVEVLLRLRQKGIGAQLTIVGKSLLPAEKDYEDRIRAFAGQQDVADFVYFAGFRPDILDVMDAADAVLLTSRYEGLPNVAVEALLAATPMVAYEVSGVREVLRDGVTGYIVPQGDIGAAVESLASLYRDRGTKTAVHDPTRQRILDSFREQVMLERKMVLYEKLLSTNGSAD